MCPLLESCALISNGQERTTRRGQVDTGRVRCTPDTYAERSAKTQEHRTRPPDAPGQHQTLTQRILQNHWGTGRMNSVQPRPMLSVRCSAFTYDSNRERTRRSEVASGAYGYSIRWKFLVRNFLLVHKKLSTGIQETFHQHTRNFLLAHKKLSTSIQETFHWHTRNFLLAHKKLSIGTKETFYGRKGNFPPPSQSVPTP